MPNPPQVPESDIVKTLLENKERYLKEEGADLLHNQFGLEASEVAGVTAEFSKKREGLFGELMDISSEVGESWLVRQFPTISKWIDIFRNVGGKFIPGLKEEENLHSAQNEIEGWTAFASLFIPDSWLRNITDPIYNSDIFMGLVGHWPVGGDALASKISGSNGDPDHIIDAIRAMHQDVATGKVTGEVLFERVLKGLIPNFS